MNFEVIIIGSGFSGLTCAHYLKEQGVENICLLEKNTSLGGVWSHGGVGSYPGAACDVQSYTYLPFLDETGFIPSKRYVSQTEIADYAELLADHFDIRRHIKFSHEVSKLEYCDEGYWIIEALKNEDSKKVKFPHVTIAIPEGGKPFNSNKIPKENFQQVEPFTIRGVVQEVPS